MQFIIAIKLIEFGWITSRSRHLKKSDEVQEAFKKFESEMNRTFPWNISHSNVDVWFQDKARIGQKNTTTRLRAEKGTSLRAVGPKNLITLIFMV